MCGIVGYFGDPGGVADGIFREMLIMDAVRGEDSCGVAAVNKRQADVVRGAIPPSTLFKTEDFKKVVNARMNYLLLGHNRHATMGAVTGKNAHPFRHGNITLVHNGTLNQQNLLPDHHLFETDSENIAYAINKLGIDETWKRINGSATLAFWDAQSMRLNFISNGRRPFNFAYLEKMKGMVFASENWTYKVALGHAHVKIQADKKGNTDYILEENMLHTFKYDKGHKVIELDDIRKLQPHTYTYHGPRTWNAGDGWTDDPNWEGTLQQERANKTLSSIEEARKRALSAQKSVDDDQKIKHPHTWECYGCNMLLNVANVAPGSNGDYCKQCFNENDMVAEDPIDKDVSGKFKCSECNRHYFWSLLATTRPNGNSVCRECDMKEAASKKPQKGEEQTLIPFSKPVSGVKSKKDKSGQLSDSKIYLRDTSRKKPDEFEFHRLYPHCCSCTRTLANEYNRSVLLDDNRALCGICADEGNITLQRMLN